MLRWLAGACRSGSAECPFHTMLHAAIVLMIGALTFYSIGVWWERIAGRLEVVHTVFFWMGLCCDTAGTEVMRRMVGGLEMNLHSLTGVTALVLMAVHAIWAVVVLRGRDERALTAFHRFSVVVWAIWLVPFVSGMLISNMSRL
jgi:uncharacterized repeat protein (TIGR03987 family)